MQNETNRCDSYEEHIESLEKEREDVRREGRQYEEDRGDLRKKLKGKEDDLSDFRETIEALEKTLEDPDKVNGK